MRGSDRSTGTAAGSAVGTVSDGVEGTADRPDQAGSAVTDIYAEPDADPDTLANLGPLGPMAGTWVGTRGADVHPAAGDVDGHDAFHERYELQPIDPQTNGPQLFYGLRYHAHIVKPGEVETFHDQVGYWLWEPASATVAFTLAIPRGQVLLAHGAAAPDATGFEVTATLGSDTYGILSNPFLGANFRTVSFRMGVSNGADGTWSYEEDTMLVVPGRAGLVRHRDTNTLTRVDAPIPNPLARGEAPTR